MTVPEATSPCVRCGNTEGRPLLTAPELYLCDDCSRAVVERLEDVRTGGTRADQLDMDYWIARSRLAELDKAVRKIIDDPETDAELVLRAIDTSLEAGDQLAKLAGLYSNDPFDADMRSLSARMKAQVNDSDEDTES